VKRATAQPKTGIIRVCGVVETLPVFEAGWLESVYFFSSLFVWNFRIHEHLKRLN
jgi:hypothetical protein